MEFESLMLKILKYTEEKAMVVAAVWGTHLNAAIAVQQQGWFEEKFLEEHPFWEGLWFGVV